MCIHNSTSRTKLFDPAIRNIDHPRVGQGVAGSSVTIGAGDCKGKVIQGIQGIFTPGINCASLDAYDEGFYIDYVSAMGNNLLFFQ
jgi:hypothetical protein